MSRSIRYVTVGLLVLLAVTVLLSVGAWRWVAQWRTDPAAITGSGIFILDAGQSFGSFAHELHAAGVIEHPRLWTWLARLDDTARQVKAGEYRVGPGDTPDGLMARLLTRDVVTWQVTLVEGLTVAEVLARLAADPVLRHELVAVAPDALLAHLGLPAGPAEGRFFPDTYQFERGDSDRDILLRAHARMVSVLSQAWAMRAPDVPWQSPDEALIVASLVEKETGQDADRPLIAQVFANRVRRGMRLQTDPSVIYGLGHAFDGNLTRAHLRQDTPYNTYVRHGLPPTPIALPGAASIHATLHPAAGDYLYFVSRGDGSSAFSVTLAEHNRAVRRYQLR